MEESGFSAVNGWEDSKLMARPGLCRPKWQQSIIPSVSPWEGWSLSCTGGWDVCECVRMCHWLFCLFRFSLGTAYKCCTQGSQDQSEGLQDARKNMKEGKSHFRYTNFGLFFQISLLIKLCTFSPQKMTYSTRAVSVITLHSDLNWCRNSSCSLGCLCTPISSWKEKHLLLSST